MTITNSELEVFEDLSFDEELSCENPKKECPDVASWNVTMTCCNFSVDLCNECTHKVRMFEKIFGNMAVCNNCNTKNPKSTYVKLPGR